MTTLARVLATIFVVLFTSKYAQSQGSQRRVCYYTNWSQYRPGIGKYGPEQVDATLCTHYMYAFATLSGDYIHPFEWNDESTEWSKGMYERFHALKEKNPAIKIILAVGGWNLGSAPFSHVVATPQDRKTFAQSVVAFLKQWHFDGLDLDWEYPANRGSQPEDKDRYTELIKELRAQFEQDAAITGSPRLLLSAAVAAGKPVIDTAYDVPALEQYLDFMNVMTYDLHGSWETYTGHHTALYPRRDETGNDKYLNLDYVAQYWVQKGASREKLNIGLATYGRSFTLANPSQTGLGAAAVGAGQAGPQTREAGFLAYYEICQMLSNGGQSHDDLEQHVRYATQGTLWAGYEDAKSLREKACYVKQNGYGGVMIWALDLDDFSGQACGEGIYPLLNAIKNELASPSYNNCPSPGTGPVPTTQAPIIITLPPRTQNPNQGPQNTFVLNLGTPTAGPPLTSAPLASGTNTRSPMVEVNDFPCDKLSNDLYPDPTACDQYYICANHVAFHVSCSSGQYYNPITRQCDLSARVYCYNAHAAQTTKQPQVETQPPPHTQPPQFETTQSPVQQTQPVSTQPGTNLSAKEFCVIMPDGQYRHPIDCNKYFQCYLHTGSDTKCPTGQVFHQALQTCESPSRVPECSSYVDPLFIHS